MRVYTTLSNSRLFDNNLTSHNSLEFSAILCYTFLVLVYR